MKSIKIEIDHGNDFDTTEKDQYSDGQRKTTQQKSGMRQKRQHSLVKNNCYTICKRKVAELAELAAPTKLLFNL